MASPRTTRGEVQGVAGRRTRSWCDGQLSQATITRCSASRSRSAAGSSPMPIDDGRESGGGDQRRVLGAAFRPQPRRPRPHAGRAGPAGVNRRRHRRRFSWRAAGHADRRHPHDCPARDGRTGLPHHAGFVDEPVSRRPPQTRRHVGCRARGNAVRLSTVLGRAGKQVGEGIGERGSSGGAESGGTRMELGAAELSRIAAAADGDGGRRPADRLLQRGKSPAGAGRGANPGGRGAHEHRRQPGSPRSPVPDRERGAGRGGRRRGTDRGDVGNTDHRRDARRRYRSHRARPRSRRARADVSDGRIGDHRSRLWTGSGDQGDARRRHARTAGSGLSRGQWPVRRSAVARSSCARSPCAWCSSPAARCSCAV